MAQRQVPPAEFVTSEEIGDHGFLSDCNSGALVDSRGSVEWLCLPRFDSPSVFGRILDDDAGHWSISPTVGFDVRRRYLPGSLVLETQFSTSTGMARLTDGLVFGKGSRGHEIGGRVPHVLVRDIEVTSGEVELQVEFRPRPEYGLVRPRLHLVDGAVVARGGAAELVLCGRAPDHVTDGSARWTLRLPTGDRATFALRYHARGAPAPEVWSERRSRRRLADTVKGWRSWSDQHQGYHGHAEEQVRFSGRELNALTFQPTGAIVAAPTTSLAERAGGTRNWDYRYAWIRDTSFTLNALWVAACPDEAQRFIDFIIETAGTAPATEHGMQIMYGIGGEHDLSERQLDHLRGWRDSRPVRVGNDAWRQAQTDVFGELLDAVHRIRDGVSATPETCAFVTQLADAASAVWLKPDSGIWEARGPLRHYVYSKLMCWVALDRAASLAGWLGALDRGEVWRSEADEIKAMILEHGFNPDLGSFTQTLDGQDLDAATLMIALSGMLPVDDPRMASTIERISTELAAPCGLLYRYRNDDGVEGGDDEGVFLLCTYWLVECLAGLGQRDRAIELFDRATAFANDLGLLSEEVEPLTGTLLGNFPQALSHVGLVNAAWALTNSG